jgi:hypothetical protein
MRVLITTDVVGGVWQFTHELATGLLREGSSVALVSFGGSPAAGQRRQCACLLSDFPNSFLYESSTAPLEWMQPNESAYSDGAQLLLRIAREFGADLLHSNQFCFGALPIDVPRVITAHSDVLSWAEACREQPLENSPWLSQYVRLVGDGLNGADLVVAPTRWMLDALMRNFSVSARCEVIANGRTIPLQEGAGRQLRAVTAGRLWDEAKDICMLAQVSSPVPLYVAGPMKHESSRAPVEMGAATLLGPLPEDELLQCFRESAIYICTSRWRRWKPHCAGAQCWPAIYRRFARFGGTVRDTSATRNRSPRCWTNLPPIPTACAPPSAAHTGAPGPSAPRRW